MKMKPLVAVLTFSVVYAVGAEITEWVFVYYFNVWDTMFHNEAGNIAFFHEVLPFIVLFAALFFMVGWGVSRKLAAGMSTRYVAIGGAFSGALASVSVFLIALLPVAFTSLGDLGVVEAINFLCAPALGAFVAFRVVYRLSVSPR